MDILERQIAPSQDAVESSVGQETVILHLKSGTYFGLDAVGTLIWNLLKDGMAPKDICQHIATEFGLPREQVEMDARRFLGDLHANDIVVEI